MIASGKRQNHDRAATPDELIGAARDWLRKRGVPHFLGDVLELEHRGWHAVFSVAFATLFAILIAFVFRAEELSWRSEVGVTVGIVLIAILVDVFRRLRQRKHWPFVLPRPGYMNMAVVAALTATPVLDAALARDIRAESAIVLTGGVVTLLVIAAATPVGALRIAWWAAGHPIRELRQNLRVLAGALPLLLLTLGVLFMTTEMWQVATNLTVEELFGTVGLFGGLGLAFLLMVAAIRIGEASRFSSWDEVRECLDEYPTIGGRPQPRHAGYGALDSALGGLHAPEAARDRLFRRQRNTRENLELLRESEWPDGMHLERVPDLDPRERWNVVLVALVGQGFQVLAVSLCLGAFFLVFGWLVVDQATLEAWEIDPQSGLDPWTGQHLKVSALVATFAGLSYAVSATLLSEQRELFLGQLDHKMQQRLAVRALYRQLRDRAAGSG